MQSPRRGFKSQNIPETLVSNPFALPAPRPMPNYDSMQSQPPPHWPSNSNRQSSSAPIHGRPKPFSHHNDASPPRQPSPPSGDSFIISSPRITKDKSSSLAATPPSASLPLSHRSPRHSSERNDLSVLNKGPSSTSKVFANAERHPIFGFAFPPKLPAPEVQDMDNFLLSGQQAQIVHLQAEKPSPVSARLAKLLPSINGRAPATLESAENIISELEATVKRQAEEARMEVSKREMVESKLERVQAERRSLLLQFETMQRETEAQTMVLREELGMRVSSLHEELEKFRKEMEKERKQCAAHAEEITALHAEKQKLQEQVVKTRQRLKEALAVAAAATASAAPASPSSPAPAPASPPAPSVPSPSSKSKQRKHAKQQQQQESPPISPPLSPSSSSAVFPPPLPLSRPSTSSSSSVEETALKKQLLDMQKRIEQQQSLLRSKDDQIQRLESDLEQKNKSLLDFSSETGMEMQVAEVEVEKLRHVLDVKRRECVAKEEKIVQLQAQVKQLQASNNSRSRQLPSSSFGVGVGAGSAASPPSISADLLVSYEEEVRRERDARTALEAKFEEEKTKRQLLEEVLSQEDESREEIEAQLLAQQQMLHSETMRANLLEKRVQEVLESDTVRAMQIAKAAGEAEKMQLEIQKFRSGLRDELGPLLATLSAGFSDSRAKADAAKRLEQFIFKFSPNSNSNL